MPTTYTPSNAKLEKLIATNARVDDLLKNASATGAQNLLSARTDATDGWIWHGADKILVTSDTTLPVLVRTAAGNYSLDRSAGGAENVFVATVLTLPARLTALKGFKIIDVEFHYIIATAGATTITPAVKATTYADGAAPSVADFGGTLAFNAAYDTNAERVAAAATPKRVIATLGTPIFQVTDLVAIVPEMTVVLANTCVFKMLGFGFHYTYDYL